MIPFTYFIVWIQPEYEHSFKNYTCVCFIVNKYEEQDNIKSNISFIAKLLRIKYVYQNFRNGNIRCYKILIIFRYDKT